MYAHLEDSRSKNASEPTSRKILIADDNDANRLVMGLMLEMLGYEHDDVCSGHDVLFCLKKHPYLGVMMDIRMPNLDGLETTRRIRQFELAYGRRAIPIIAVTADVSVLSKSSCLDAGMNGFITKPYTYSELGKAVDILEARGIDLSS